MAERLYDIMLVGDTVAENQPRYRPAVDIQERSFYRHAFLYRLRVTPAKRPIQPARRPGRDFLLRAPCERPDDCVPRLVGSVLPFGSSYVCNIYLFIYSSRLERDRLEHETVDRCPGVSLRTR